MSLISLLESFGASGTIKYSIHDSKLTVELISPRKRKEKDADIVRRESTVNIVSVYCDLFKQKYGITPKIDGKTAGVAKNLAKTLGPNAEKYLEAFFQMPDAMLVKAKHPLSMLSLKLNEVVVFCDSGKFTTRQEAYEVDKKLTKEIQRNNLANDFERDLIE